MVFVPIFPGCVLAMYSVKRLPENSDTCGFLDALNVILTVLPVVVYTLARAVSSRYHNEYLLGHHVGVCIMEVDEKTMR